MTISARELRIGNIHEIEGLEIPRLGISSIKVDGKSYARITGYGIQLVEEGTLDFKPIPITEEWLLKWGFKLDEYRFVFNQWRVTSGRPLYKWILGCDACPYMGKLEYVHQLQNLYFALTGEELELTSNKEQP